MKAKTICILLMMLVLTITANYAQQEFTLTTGAANITASKATIDLPGLAGNPNAIIVATPLDDPATSNPHAIGVWYYGGKWNIFNTDHNNMPTGLRFKLEIYLSPAVNQFLHVVSGANFGSVRSYIDYPALNNNPNAQVRILQNHAPDNRTGFALNKYEAKAGYDASTGKWYIANINGNPLSPNTAYNIVITPGGTVGSTPSTISPNPSIVTMPTPTNLPVTEPTTIDPATLPTVKHQPSKSIQLGFDNLNNFVEKGLPPSADFPIDDLDLAAVMMAQQISKSDENSLPILLTALQTAGFTIIDETGKVLRTPIGEGKGQGLAIFDFEAVGALKLANHGVSLSLEKVAGQIVKGVPQISASEFADRYGTGDFQGKVDGGISLDKNSYQISITPPTINGTLQSGTENSSSGGVVQINHPFQITVLKNGSGDQTIILSEEANWKTTITSCQEVTPRPEQFRSQVIHLQHPGWQVAKQPEVSRSSRPSPGICSDVAGT
jgi:hypothetical protein